MAHQLYLIEMVTYGASHPIKVGISKNAKRRARQFTGNLCPNLLGYYEVPDENIARALESFVHRSFPVCPRYGRYSHEILAASEQRIRGLIESIIKSSFIACGGRS